jgi:DNA-binding cell septation regulator SpoVG
MPSRKLHDDEWLAIVLPVNGANIWVIQGSSGLSLALKTG